MAKFKIPSIPPTINKVVRFLSNLAEKVERAIQGQNCTFSTFVVAAMCSAFEQLKESSNR